MCQIFAGQPRSNYETERRSVRLNGHSTSIQLEKMFWRVLEELAENQGMTQAKFITTLYDEVLADQGEVHNFASMLRCCCLIYLDRVAAEEGPRFAMPSGAPAIVAAAE